MITWHPDYLYSFDLNSLNNDILFKECLMIEDYLKNYITSSDPLKDFGSFTTSNYQQYNLFTFPANELSKLYRELVKYILPLLDTQEHYILKCWLNVFRKDEFIGSHSHWPSQFKSWHGFYCVNVEDSFTEYEIPNVKNKIKVPSKEGRIVIGKSDGDLHKSSKWTNPFKPRITIAFDIIPHSSLENHFAGPNCYIPFK